MENQFRISTRLLKRNLTLQLINYHVLHVKVSPFCTLSREKFREIDFSFVILGKREGDIDSLCSLQRQFQMSNQTLKTTQENCDKLLAKGKFLQILREIAISKFFHRVRTFSVAETITVFPKRKNKPIKNPNAHNPWPKPPLSQANLIMMAIKNSPNGSLSVAEIYGFMMEHFPYYKCQPTDIWKNTVRHCATVTKWFTKVIINDENEVLPKSKGFRYALNYEYLGTCNYRFILIIFIT